MEQGFSKGLAFRLHGSSSHPQERVLDVSVDFFPISSERSEHGHIPCTRFHGCRRRQKRRRHGVCRLGDRGSSLRQAQGQHYRELSYNRTSSWTFTSSVFLQGSPVFPTRNKICQGCERVCGKWPGTHWITLRGVFLLHLWHSRDRLSKFTRMKWLMTIIQEN